jgi:hypothetical protein
VCQFARQRISAALIPSSGKGVESGRSPTIDVKTLHNGNDKSPEAIDPGAIDHVLVWVRTGL